MTQPLLQLTQDALTSIEVNVEHLYQLAVELQNAKHFFQAEAVYNKLFYHQPTNDHHLAKYLSFLTSTDQIRKALDFLIHVITDIHTSKDRETWLLQLVNSLPGSEDWQRRLQPFTSIDQIEFKPLMDLDSYCAQNDIKLKTLKNSEVINLPVVNANTKIYQHNMSGSYIQPQVKYAIVENLGSTSLSYAYHTKGTLIRAEFSYTNRDDYILNGAGESYVFYVPEKRCYSNKGIVKKQTQTKKVAGLSLSLLSPSSSNYFHFMFEQLPKVLLLQELTFDEPITILAPKNTPINIKQILEIYHIDFEVEYIEETTFVEAERSIIITGLGNVVCDLRPDKNPLLADNCISKFSLEMLRNKLRQSSKCSAKRKIYLQRPVKEGDRGDLHDQAVAKLVTSMGFEVVSPEKLSFEQQIELFQQSAVVLGFSGAAFTNIIFCQAKTKVVIITASEGNKSDYGVWTKPAYFFDLELSLFCTYHVGANHIYKNFCDKGVNVSELKSYLEKVLLQ